MEVYRITKSQYAGDLSGYGAFLYGGRWNKKGVHTLYTSSHRSLALLELMAHTPISILKNEAYIISTIDVPDQISFEDIDVSEEVLKDIAACQLLAEENMFQKNKLAIIVPSVLVPQEKNYIFNGSHSEIERLKITDQRELEIDKRYFI
ncbi:MAG: RES family NAD+ phosphorylase [Saprospiraceae bacterium]|nr:RES family NAD+ phosphorylase [Saprospiraceae bacterium]